MGICNAPGAILLPAAVLQQAATHCCRQGSARCPVSGTSGRPPACFRLERSMWKPCEATTAPVPGACASTTASASISCNQLVRVPKASQQLAAQLAQQSGTTQCTMSLSSSRYGLFGTAAARAGITTEAWLAGDNSAVLAMQALAGPPRQTCVLDSSSGSTSTVHSTEGSRRSRGTAVIEAAQQQASVQTARSRGGAPVGFFSTFAELPLCRSTIPAAIYSLQNTTSCLCKSTPVLSQQLATEAE